MKLIIKNERGVSMIDLEEPIPEEVEMEDMYCIFERDAYCHGCGDCENKQSKEEE